ncbi:MAG: hypothetical protein AAFR96_09840 [Planctomycetota bacterium]
MDDRSREIREGAGLEESRVNTELIALINKYSSHVLIGLALIVGAYAGKQFLDRRANDNVNEAFAQHVDITETASPEPGSLGVLVSNYGDVRGIGTMARLREADVYLRAVATGTVPNAEFEVDPETQAPTNRVVESDLLSDEDASEYLDRADRLYSEVIAGVDGGVGSAVHEVGAWFGKAAVAESRGDAAAAQSAYESAIGAAERGGFRMYAELARARIGSIETAIADATLYSQDDLPEIPEPEPAPAVEVGGEPIVLPDMTAGDEPTASEQDAETDAGPMPESEDAPSEGAAPSDGG